MSSRLPFRYRSSRRNIKAGNASVHLPASVRTVTVSAIGVLYTVQALAGTQASAPKSNAIPPLDGDRSATSPSGQDPNLIAVDGKRQAPFPSSIPPSAAEETRPDTGALKKTAITEFGGLKLGSDQSVDATDVRFEYRGAELTADRALGNMNAEIILSGHAHLHSHEFDAEADAIHTNPRSGAFRLVNVRGVIDPSVLQGKVTDPVFLEGGDLMGQKSGYLDAGKTTATTCLEKHHHYEIKANEAELYPHEKIVLRKASFFLFGVKVLTIPYLVIPIDQKLKRPRTNYLPEFGQNSIEGYYARFPYEFPEKSFAATFLRLDFTEKKGLGYRVEQQYLAGKQQHAYNTRGVTASQGFTGSLSGSIANAYGYGSAGAGLSHMGTGLGPQSGGLLAFQGYFKEGFNKDFTASFRHQQGIGGNNRISLTTQLTNNSFYTAGTQTNQSTQINFNHSDPAHGAVADLALGITSNDSSLASNHQLTASLRQSWDFASKGLNRNTLSYSLNYSHSDSSYTSGGAGAGTVGTVTSNSSGSLDSQFQFQHLSRDYTIGLTANKSFSLVSTSGSGSFGTLEKLPELQFSTQTINYKGGYFAKLPAEFDLSVGRYSEPGHANQSRLDNDRVDFGFKVQDFTLMRGRTEMTTNGGFEQRFYSDTAAQYMISDTTRLRQHLGGRSGFDLTYNYQRPEGATPFYFDLFNRVNNLTAEAGYLDDRHFQLTLQTGYNFLKDFSTAPWQSVSTRMMYRPNDRIRFDSVATYDINTNQWFNLTNSIRYRYKKDQSIDLVGVYDPTIKRWSQLNSQFQMPVGKHWKVAGLLRYNGTLKQFSTINYQVTHDWDCMEASLTYSDSPSSYVNTREIFLTLRIKAFPYFRSFARGPAGETLNAGTAGIF